MLFKKNFLILCLFFLISLPAYFSLLHPGMLTSHDGEGHIIRMHEFNTAIGDGDFPVRWSKRLNWGLGYPYFNFNYPLTYYLTFLFSKAGLELLTSFKLILILSFPLSGFFCYLWLKQHFSTLASLVGGFFYTFIPYHFLNVYVRGNIAETLALTFVPLGFYFVNGLYQKSDKYLTFFLALTISSIILFHNITALLYLPIMFLYGVALSLPKLKLNYLKFLLLSYFEALAIGCFFWLPALYDKQFIIIDQVFPLYFLKNFPAIKDLVYSPWGFGGSNTGPGQMSPQIGVLHQMVIAASILFLGFSKQKKKITFFFLGLTFITIFLITDLSKPIWMIVAPLQYLQFPWRLLSILALSVSFLSASLLSSFKKALPILAVLLIAGLLFFNRNHWRANEYYNLPDYWFYDRPYKSTTTVDGEHTPKWQRENMPDSSLRFEVIKGSPKVENILWKTNLHKFMIEASSSSIILDRTVYFPGWTVFINNQRINQLDPYNPITKGLIGFEVPAGKNNIEVKLLEPTINKVANSVTVISFIALLIVMIFL